MNYFLAYNILCNTSISKNVTLRMDLTIVYRMSNLVIIERNSKASQSLKQSKNTFPFVSMCEVKHDAVGLYTLVTEGPEFIYIYVCGCSL